MASTVKPKGRVSEALSSESTEASAGLCSTCNNSSTCVHREFRGRDAQYCEMFDIGNGSRPSHSATLVTAVKPDDRRKGRQAELKGLCVNCENRDTCILPKAESGVWHCEEYR